MSYARTLSAMPQPLQDRPTRMGQCEVLTLWNEVTWWKPDAIRVGCWAAVSGARGLH